MANRRRYETVDDIPPFARSVGGAKAEGITIQATCPTCRVFRPVDLDRVIAGRGPGYSFVNKRLRCTLTPDCKGWVRFSHSGRGVMRYMETPDFIDWWNERERATRQTAADAIRSYADEREAKRKKAQR